MTKNVIELEQYRREVSEQTETLLAYENDGTLQGMMIESHVRLTNLVDRLIGIVATQQEAIDELARHVNEEGSSKHDRH